MIEWLTAVNVGLSFVAGLVAIVAGIRGNPPRDVTVLSTLAVALIVIVQLVVAIVQPLVGNAAQGDALEFWLYLITALVMPIGVVIWALIDRTRFATIGMGIVSLAVSVMFVRMAVIWTGA
jgi:hypothetical protein